MKERENKIDPRGAWKAMQKISNMYAGHCTPRQVIGHCQDAPSQRRCNGNPARLLPTGYLLKVTHWIRTSDARVATLSQQPNDSGRDDDPNHLVNRHYQDTMGDGQTEVCDFSSGFASCADAS